MCVKITNRDEEELYHKENEPFEIDAEEQECCPLALKIIV